MRRREIALVVTAAVVAVACVRLGVWQLERLRERRAWNATVLSEYQRPVTPLEQLSSGDSVRYRRVTITGRYDHSRELVLANRARRGSPGVHLLTPLLREGTDTAVLVLRGWVYAPDAARADVARWREHSARGVAGYVRGFDESSRDPPLLEGVLKTLNYDWIATAVPYPLARYVVVLTDTGGAGPDVPPRLDEPLLGEGNHLSYAFQWFGFAAVAVAGTAVYLLHAGRRREDRGEQVEQSNE